MTKPEISLVVRELRSCVANATRQAPSTDVAIKAKHHLLDMLAWMFLRTLLMPSPKAVAYARLQSGAAEATEAGTDLITSTVKDSSSSMVSPESNLIYFNDRMNLCRCSLNRKIFPLKVLSKS